MYVCRVYRICTSRVGEDLIVRIVGFIFGVVYLVIGRWDGNTRVLVVVRVLMLLL
ncbi:hypothetical protein BDW42DRAFT_159632 [Aspergillus taichungensis]|uniref:Uncharacterized protein n=1 Tax=Aspergillus taichungensis TaxID=482145 RepID=A0A2J5I7D2_9EURO|nr:hypothetical protein BDW42DRAFT_159632 [Aspergillus taichungensis]